MRRRGCGAPWRKAEGAAWQRGWFGAAQARMDGAAGIVNTAGQPTGPEGVHAGRNAGTHARIKAHTQAVTTGRGRAGRQARRGRAGQSRLGSTAKHSTGYSVSPTPLLCQLLKRFGIRHHQRAQGAVVLAHQHCSRGSMHGRVSWHAFGAS